MATHTEELRSLQQRIEATADGLVDTDPIALRDLAYEAARALQGVSNSATMFLVIEEVDFESYYLAHGDPVSVHWNEAEANSAADRAKEEHPGEVYKVLPVKVG